MTLRSAIVSALNAANLPGDVDPPVYRDDAPNAPPYPHLVLRMDPGASILLAGDSRVLARNRNASLSVYAAQATEDEALPLAVVAVLDGYRSPGMKIRIVSWRRVIDQTLPVVQWDLDINAIYWT